jgi:hypothetical protein
MGRGGSGAEVDEHVHGSDSGEGEGAAQSLREEKSVAAVRGLGREGTTGRKEIRARVA